MATNTPIKAREKAYDYMFKILLIGDGNTGKTALLRRFADENVDKFITTIGIDFKIKLLTLAGKKIKLQLWDTAGQERFRRITTAYYRGSHAVLLLFNVADRQTFTGIEGWLSSVSSQGPENCIIVLVGNRTDQRHREVTPEDAELFAKQKGVSYFETNVIDNSSVEGPFLHVTKQLLQSKGINIQ